MTDWPYVFERIKIMNSMYLRIDQAEKNQILKSKLIHHLVSKNNIIR